MLQNKLASSFSDSLNEECKKIATDAVELSLDSLLKDSALKDIPFISTAVSLYNIGVSIKDIHNIKKLAIFLEDLNKKILNTSDLEKYKARSFYRYRRLWYVPSGADIPFKGIFHHRLRQ